MVTLSVGKLQELLKDSELAHKVRGLVKESEGESNGEGYSGEGDRVGRRTASSGRGDDTEEEPEIDRDVQVIHRGDTHCMRCNKNYESTTNLEKTCEIVP